METTVSDLTAIQRAVSQQIELSRKKLLDLSLRNRLLAYRPAKQRSLLITDELAREVFDTLVLQGRAMGFRASQMTRNQDNLSFEDDEIIEESEKIAWQLPDNEAVAQHHTDRHLQTTLQPEQLQKRLHRVESEARSFFEEQGYSILYLALGFLNWTEAESSNEVHRAPLILIPVKLSRAGVASAYRLAWTGDEIATNISLQEELKKQYVSFPHFETPEEKDGIDDYYNTVSQTVKPKKEWSVTAEIYLDFFSFTKFVMWKDLEHSNWPEKQKPYDQTLLHELYGQSYPKSSINPITEAQIDEKLKARDLHHVRDADPSQICVLEAIKAGQNLVVQGPPGTGKSQTIVNAIAELLGAGKRVLFVSEKMAALNVVLDRLRESGIDRYCLALHSRNTNKLELMKELRRAFEYNVGPTGADLYHYQEHENLKLELNRLAEILRTPFGKIQWTPYKLVGIVETTWRHFEKAGSSVPEMLITSPSEVDFDAWDAARRHLVQLVQLMGLIWPVAKHPWRLTCPPLILPGDEKHVVDSLTRCLNLHVKVVKEMQSLAGISGLTIPRTLNEIQSALAAAEIVAQSEPNDPEVLMNAEWIQPNEQAYHLIQDLHSYQVLRRQVDALYKDESLSAVSRQDLYEMRLLYHKWYRYLVAGFWRKRSFLRGLYLMKAPRMTNALIEHLEILVEAVEVQQQLQANDSLGKTLFGRHWHGEQSNPTQLQRFADWVVLFWNEAINSVLTYDATIIVEKGAPTEEIRAAKLRVEQLTTQYAEEIARLDAQIHVDWVGQLGTEIQEADLSKLRSQFRNWLRHADHLRNWAQYVTLRDSQPDLISQNVIQAVEDGRIRSTQDVLPSLHGGFADAMLRYAIGKNDTLHKFAGVLHEQSIRDFVKLEKDILRLNGTRLASQLSNRVPEMANRLPKESPLWRLRHQMSLQRRHMPIRKLLHETGELVQQLKPCFMMSPLSVAQFLEPGNLTFDTVIFDEASQVRTEDALGAILRGRQVVIMGDKMQLPPTSFFDKFASDENLDEDVEERVETSEKNESILERAETPWPGRMLTWHYRSRHESLIQFSNSEFYKNQLQVFPSPRSDDKSLGLKLIHIPESVYDRGNSRTNRIEATHIAEAVMDHFRQRPDKSLGVGAFSAAQERAITDALELQRKQHPDLEEYFRDDRPEKFFVKNLETIQGDERDVIFISVGFGRDANGEIKKQFGPLIISGGERRLNVLITRAKEHCVVFTNFLAEDLEISKQESKGVEKLRAFLYFAKNRTLPVITAGLEESDSQFEEAVHDFLSYSGYKVNKQIGCAKYRIDLAVVHPKEPGRYVIGIECDGAMYHSSRVARERDRLRQQILENLGWKLHRIWSTDWYRSREDTRKRLLRAIETALLS